MPLLWKRRESPASRSSCIKCVRIPRDYTHLVFEINNRTGFTRFLNAILKVTKPPGPARSGSSCLSHADKGLGRVTRRPQSFVPRRERPSCHPHCHPRGSPRSPFIHRVGRTCPRGPGPRPEQRLGAVEAPTPGAGAHQWPQSPSTATAAPLRLVTSEPGFSASGPTPSPTPVPAPTPSPGPAPRPR